MGDVVVGWGTKIGVLASLPKTSTHRPRPLYPTPPLRKCSSQVNGVLASLPKMTPQALATFRQQLLSTGSEKAQVGCAYVGVGWGAAASKQRGQPTAWVPLLRGCFPLRPVTIHSKHSQ